MNQFLHLKTVFVVLMAVVAGFSEAAASADTTYSVVKRLDQDWLVYNKKFNDYVFYLPEQYKNTHTVNQWLEIEKYKNYKIGFNAPPGLTLFVNNRLVYKNIEMTPQQVYFDIADFVKYEREGRALLSFYNTNFQLPLNTTCIYSKKLSTTSIHPHLTSFKVLKRDKKVNISLYVLYFLMVLLLIVFVKHLYMRRFHDFFGFQNVLPNIWMEETAILKVYSSPIILILLINSILLAIITGLTGGLYSILYKFSFIFHVESGLFRQLLFCTIIYFSVLLGKYFVLSVISWIFNLGEIVKIQYFEFIKGLLKLNIFIATVALVIVCMYNSTNLQALQLMDKLFVALLIFIVLRTVFLIFKLTAFRNIYLFSYLCTTEIMPLAIIIKIILFWNN